MIFDAETQDLIEWYQLMHDGHELPVPPFWVEPHIKVTGAAYYENINRQIEAGPWKASRLAETLRALKAHCERKSA